MPENSTNNSKPEITSFTDDFSDPSSGWPISENAEFKYGYKDGKYVIILKKANLIFFALAPIANLSSEYTMQSDMELVNGTGSYGFVFDYLNSNNFYILQVNPTFQFYEIWRMIDGWENVTDIIYEPEFINQSFNYVRLVKKGNKVKIYLNDNLLSEIEIGSQSEGIRIGIYTATILDGSYLPFVSQYDNFKVSGIF